MEVGSLVAAGGVYECHAISVDGVEYLVLYRLRVSRGLVLELDSVTENGLVVWSRAGEEVFLEQCGCRNFHIECGMFWIEQAPYIAVFRLGGDLLYAFRFGAERNYASGDQLTRIANQSGRVVCSRVLPVDVVESFKNAA